MVDYSPDRISPFDSHPTREGHHTIAEQMKPAILASLRGRSPIDWSTTKIAWPSSRSIPTGVSFEFPRDAGEVEPINASVKEERDGIVLTKAGRNIGGD